MLVRASTILLALVGVVAFPWPLTVVFVFIAALFLPPLALLCGVLYDILYFVPGAYPFPLATLLGLAGFLVAEVVHGFVKTRIMGA
ncbi:MAG: hypothetical protein AAB582_03120 [Patescibacteria group bacterium]